MTMLITKFHGLIRSRLLWGSFLVIVIFTFVIWGTQMPNQTSEASAPGTLDGKPVPAEEFQSARFNTLMSVILAIGRPLTSLTPEMETQIRESAWKRLAALREAKALGLTATDPEVREAIQSHPGFVVENRFSPAKYGAFVQGMLMPMGFSEIQFEEHVREEIALQKLQQMVMQAVLVSPYEITRTFRSLTDTFKVEYVALTEKLVEKDVDITTEKAKTFFEADPSKFTVPEKVRAKYVRFAVSDHLGEAVTNEDDALAYYDEHIDDYTVTNALAEAKEKETDSNAPPSLSLTNAVVEEPTNEIVTLTFDQVKTNILEILTLEAARNRAADAATDFVVSLAPDREGKAPTFEEAAGKARLEITKLEPFSLTDEVPGIDAGPNFNHFVFNLNANSDEYFSDAIPGSNYVYVVALEERIPERIPEFKEVADKVKEEARRQALNEALSKKAQEVREAALKAVEKGKTFAAAVAPFDLDPVKLGPFTAAEGLETNEHYEVILRGILARNQGEVTDLLSAEDAVLLAYVDQRTPGDPAALESLRPQIRDSVRRQRSRLLFDDWQDGLLRLASFEDRSQPPPEEEEDEGAEADDVPADEEPAPEEPL